MGLELELDPVPSPCRGACQLDAREVCRGCGRTLEEIAAWPTAGEARRAAIVRDARRRLGTPGDTQP